MESPPHPPVGAGMPWSLCCQPNSHFIDEEAEAWKERPPTITPWLGAALGLGPRQLGSRTQVPSSPSCSHKKLQKSTLFWQDTSWPECPPHPLASRFCIQSPGLPGCGRRWVITPLCVHRCGSGPHSAGATPERGRAEWGAARRESRRERRCLLPGKHSRLHTFLQKT